MEQEDANLRELLLLHGHLPAEIATITTRSSTDFSTAIHVMETIEATPDANANGNVNLEDTSTVNGEGSMSHDGIDWISKLDFLEFCVATVDIIQYSII